MTLHLNIARYLAVVESDISDKLTGCQEPIEWPPLPPELTPQDLFQSGRLKEGVHAVLKDIKILWQDFKQL
jgi:hypothetical protein